MEDPRIRALAVFLIQNAVELQAGENILIELHGNAPALAKALIQESYKRGAHPYFQRFDYELETEIARGADEEHMSAIAAYEIERMKNMNAYIDIRDYDNIYVWSGLPEKQTSMYAQRYWGPLHLRQRCNHTKWSVLRYPNPSMAQLAGMDTPSYEDFYFRACLCDYRKMEAALKPLKALMDRTDRVQILGKGTDISFSIKGIGSYPMHGNRNIPDGEIYSAPVRNSVNGVVSYNVPSTYEGTLFTDVVLTFENGKITDAVCNDSPRLNRILDTDEGARYIGEFALGVNPVITKPFNDILFDEKIAGSFHLTPGSCYENTDNGNKSAVHWDLVQILTPQYGGGTVLFDDVVIQKDGLFVLETLQELNPDRLLASGSVEGGL